MGCLYQISFPNGKSYIGITSKTAEERMAVHWYMRNQRGYAINHAMRKFDQDSISVKTLVIGAWDYLCDLEAKAIALFNTKAPHGYNMTDGGDVPRGLTEESLAKMSATHKGNTYRKGIKHTPEAKAKMSASRIGRTMSNEARAKIGAASKGNKHNVGRVTPEDVKLNMSMAKRGKSYKETASGEIGISFDKQTGKWRALITVMHKTIHLGRFANIEDAKQARKEGEAKYFKESVE